MFYILTLDNYDLHRPTYTGPFETKDMGRLFAKANNLSSYTFVTTLPTYIKAINPWSQPQ